MRPVLTAAAMRAAEQRAIDAGTSVAGEMQALQDTMQGIREYYGFGYGERPYKANISGR